MFDEWWNDDQADLEDLAEELDQRERDLDDRYLDCRFV